MKEKDIWNNEELNYMVENERKTRKLGLVMVLYKQSTVVKNDRIKK